MPPISRFPVTEFLITMLSTEMVATAVGTQRLEAFFRDEVLRLRGLTTA